ncbi:hypothetical protein [Marinomonas sp. PE14-40]|uniref:hypothetical protein n=1 Tax=Marinomonas sp. PE14-40 TaxID=3060621 RepID=UPI003F66EACC
MASKKQLADILGITVKTLRNNEKDGYSPVYLESGDVDIDASIRTFIKFQSEVIRIMKANLGRKQGGNSGNTKAHKSTEDWRKEKEKQAAIKLHIANSEAMGNLVPADAMTELYNAPLSVFRNHLSDLSNQIQKRLSIKPKDVSAIDQVVEEVFDSLEEVGKDELQPLIDKVLEKYSRHYVPTEEDTFNGLE